MELTQQQIAALRNPPPDALKQIKGGRLNGKSDINPQWRIDAMNTVFGLCGIGWKWDLKRVWREDGNGCEVFAFAEVAVSVKDGDKWSEPIPGTGGHKIVIQETNGPHNNDEAYKMAITDALSVAFKFLGIGAEIYRGHEKTKYGSSDRTAEQPQSAPQPAPTMSQPPSKPELPPLSKAKGIIDKVSSKPTSSGGIRFGLCIDNTWYNTFDGEIGLSKAGDFVEFGYTESKFGKTIASNTFTKQSAPEKTSIPTKDDDLPF